eukprot:CAMPEP_0116086374 /NCGR_PEP_ID=MMETSP0327-20121206/4821_1 /TAXON_ID=44447 /ORGANISM="Pseudo-nitzschia delicatissima, Strain B596" /LENGTH=425 /DNA_ID=CAMNT_0003577421 /DNA_START=494 /DNA_END=1771 /DNA_ORIENTATION=+
MAGKEGQGLIKAQYQSDPGETEDEEVKRNCIMGESGIRDSDFFDTDTDDEEVKEEEEVENEVQSDDDSTEALDGDEVEERMVDLVKFVTVGSQILKPKGVALCRPMPIVPTTVVHAKKLNDSDEASRGSNVKINLSPSTSSSSCFSPTSKGDNEMEISPSSSSRDSDSDSNDGDVESVDSDTENKSSSVHFPFDREDGLPLEAVPGSINIAPSIDESCCKSSIEDQQEAQESGDYALVGASGASVDDKWQMPKHKRVLSSNTLSTLNQEAGHDEDNAKKTRLSIDVSTIPEITLDVQALDEIIQPLPRQFLIRDESLLMGSSSDEEEDKFLSQELEEKYNRCSVANFPIPLLTPPHSPRTVDDSIEDQTMSCVEWPSNLVMDSAIIKAFASISPLSSTGKRDEKLDVEPTAKRSTPRIRTISVGT